MSDDIDRKATWRRFRGDNFSNVTSEMGFAKDDGAEMNDPLDIRDEDPLELMHYPHNRNKSSNLLDDSHNDSFRPVNRSN